MGVERMASLFVDLQTLDGINFSLYRVPDLALTVQHPRRAFMRRAIEFEIRLSYHDRILKTLPEPMQAPDAFTIAEQAPGPNFEYDDPCQSKRLLVPIVMLTDV
jgi:hypothetical protein